MLLYHLFSPSNLRSNCLMPDISISVDFFTNVFSCQQYVISDLLMQYIFQEDLISPDAVRRSGAFENISICNYYSWRYRCKTFLNPCHIIAATVGYKSIDTGCCWCTYEKDGIFISYAWNLVIS